MVQVPSRARPKYMQQGHLPGKNRALRAHLAAAAPRFLAKVAAMASMKGSVFRYWSGVTFVPCMQMARSLVTWPASMVSITAASRSWIASKGG